MPAAARKNDVGEVRALIADGANIETQHFLRGNTPLHLAAFTNAADAAKVLIESSANIEAQDIFGYTPLYDAARGNSAEAAKALIAAGAKNSCGDNEKCNEMFERLSASLKAAQEVDPAKTEG